MTDTGSIRREIRRGITNEAKMASQKCGLAMNCRACKEQRIVLPSWRCFSLFKRLQLRMECCLIIK